MARPKKKSESSLMYKLKEVPKGKWMLAFFVALFILLAPILWDFILPKQGVDPSITDKSQLVKINDLADLLTDDQETRLKEHMMPITEYGGVAFVSCLSNYDDAKTYAKSCYREYFGTGSGTLFLIDMDNRQIYIFSDGKIYNTITSAKAEAITDNIYRLASARRYYECAAQAYDQIATLLQGGQIPQPMKHICNALLSLAISLLLVFVIANVRTRISKDTEEAIFQTDVAKGFSMGSPYKKELIKEKRVRHTESSGGGGSGGGGGSSGGGGGGGSSGGGGGHSF